MKKLHRDHRGTAAVEFAFGVPIFVTFVMGFWQVGLIYWANAGVHNALGEAARFATVWPVPSTDEIEDMVEEKDFGTHNGTLTTVDADPRGDGTILLRIVYSQPTDFIFFEGPTIEVEREKLIYTPDATAADADDDADEGSGGTGGTGGDGGDTGGDTGGDDGTCWHPNPKKCQ
ncbi:TadE/TadG family type IV pilus assembly protein [Sphingomicrobium clamense]|uniref:Pilus assembly protein n=1 Tax=Sphingomicrobium clamense TaxID=2851013 RepID=A0ABS6V6S6_9SPHN|nr:TadE family protein [Sphingomicrobium sp. B8]MBW0144758.1 pilus assembly protein [Sphingomicrobium sp. B8]